MHQRKPYLIKVNVSVNVRLALALTKLTLALTLMPTAESDTSNEVNVNVNVNVNLSLGALVQCILSGARSAHICHKVADMCTSVDPCLCGPRLRALMHGVDMHACVHICSYSEQICTPC